MIAKLIWPHLKSIAALAWTWRFPLALLLAWHFHSRLIATHADFAAFRADTVKAAKQSAANQQAANRAPAAKSEAIARNSDAQAPAYYADVRAAAERMRQAPPRCPSPARVPGTDHPAEINDRPAATAELVCRPQADDDLLTGAAARAGQMHADAEALIAAGVARRNEP